MTVTCAFCSKVHFFPGKMAVGSERPCRKCGALFVVAEVDALPEPDWGAHLAQWNSQPASPLTRFELERKATQQRTPQQDAEAAQPAAPLSTWKIRRYWWNAFIYIGAVALGFAGAGYAVGVGDLRLLAVPVVALVYSHFEWLSFEITADAIIVTDLLRVRRWPRAALRDVGAYAGGWWRMTPVAMRYVELEFEAGPALKLHAGVQGDDVAGAAMVARNEDRRRNLPNIWPVDDRSADM